MRFKSDSLRAAQEHIKKYSQPLHPTLIFNNPNIVTIKFSNIDGTNSWLYA